MSSVYSLLLCLFATALADGINETTTSAPKPSICTKEYFIVRKEVTWREAFDGCPQHDGILVAIENNEDWLAVKKAILDGPTGNYWTSGSNVAAYAFMWVSTWTPVNFSQWHPDQTDLQTDGQSDYEDPESDVCIHIGDSGSGYSLFNSTCEAKMFYLCQNSTCVDQDLEPASNIDS